MATWGAVPSSCQPKGRPSDQGHAESLEVVGPHLDAVGLRTPVVAHQPALDRHLVADDRDPKRQVSGHGR